MKVTDITQTTNENNDNYLSSHEVDIVIKYRQLSEENKLTIDILINRLLKHEKEGELKC